MRKISRYRGRRRVVAVDWPERWMKRQPGCGMVVGRPGAPDTSVGDHLEAGVGVAKRVDLGVKDVAVPYRA
jgi:hypothetical protein